MFSVAHAAQDALKKAKAKEQLQGKSGGAEERFSRLTDELRRLVADPKADVESKKQRLIAGRSEIETLDTEIRKQFAETEKRDDDFLKKFNNLYPGISNEIVLQERESLARQIGVPCQKLDPSSTFDELSKYQDSFGSYELAISDLESTVSELFQKKGVPRPYKNPSTIGGLLYEIIKAKQL